MSNGARDGVAEVTKLWRAPSNVWDRCVSNPDERCNAGRIPALLALAVIVCGCADEDVVTGTVRVDGELAKAGGITLIPVDGQSGTAGAEIHDGHFTARDVPVGNYQVQINVSKIVGYQKLYDDPNSPEHPLLAEALPAKFNEESELRLQVKPGKTVVDYDLSSK